MDDAKKEIEFSNVAVNTTHSFILNQVIIKNDCFRHKNTLPTMKIDNIKIDKLKKILEMFECFKSYMVVDEDIDDSDSFSNYEKKVIKAVFHNIKYHFNTTLKKLVELSKSCAIDPRREFEEISIEFDEVLNDYDLTTVFDEIVYSAVINEINN
jgi:predicted ribosome quality control (RQC) complex YloA/Tae2 family protein